MEDADLAQAVQELQKSVAALEQRNKDLVLKLQLFSTRAVGNDWGWDKFGSEPEVAGRTSPTRGWPIVKGAASAT